MRIGVFIRAARLPFLTGSLMPVALAGALVTWQGAWEGFFYFFLTALGVVGLHSGGNLINDYYDSFGSDPLNRYATPFSGGSRVIQNGELSAETVRNLKKRGGAESRRKQPGPGFEDFTTGQGL